MKKDQLISAPEPTIRRMPTYVHYLKGLDAGPEAFISTSKMSVDLGFDPTQIRKDLSYVDIVGKNRVGYPIEQLIKAIEDFLGWNIRKDAILVGAGHLGSALLGYERLDQYGMNIIMAFDVHPAKVGEKIHGIEIRHISKMAEIIKQKNIEVGIITVPASQAQAVASMMEDSGIKAIWNFAPVSLNISKDNVFVENALLYSSLSILACKLKFINR